MEHIAYILCHGSGNRFVLLDSWATPLSGELAPLARALSRKFESDGVLLLAHRDEQFGMRMFNTDGSEAEMCGNGIRCVARLAEERYLHQPQFTLFSGGGLYPIRREEPLYGTLPTYGVEIAIRTSSQDFPQGGARFIAEAIPELEPTLRFSFLNLGNPHLVAQVEQIDYPLLEELGRRVQQLPEWFPNGVNVSLVRVLSEHEIFVATFERGVGLTYSCGTAMTASTTAMVMQGLCPAGVDIEVLNRGGKVRCCCQIQGEQITTRLVGNATFYEEGTLRWSASELALEVEQATTRHDEEALYTAFIRSLKS